MSVHRNARLGSGDRSCVAQLVGVAWEPYNAEGLSLEQTHARAAYTTRAVARAGLDLYESVEGQLDHRQLGAIRTQA